MTCLHLFFVLIVMSVMLLSVLLLLLLLLLFMLLLLLFVLPFSHWTPPLVGLRQGALTALVIRALIGSNRRKRRVGGCSHSLPPSSNPICQQEAYKHISSEGGILRSHYVVTSTGKQPTLVKHALSDRHNLISLIELTHFSSPVSGKSSQRPTSAPADV